MDYKEHYRIDAEQFDYWGADQYSPAGKRRKQKVFELCQPLPGERVLDIGSGNGWFSLYAAKAGADVTALDLSEANLAKIKAADERIHTLYGDACQVPSQEEKYDWIVALEVLEHIVDPKLAVQNWLPLLKPEGKLLITVPYKEALRYTLCIHCNQKTPVNAHLHSFDKETLIKLLNKHGYWVKQAHLFSHKLMEHFRLNELLSKAPYSWWRFWDRSCGILSRKYSYLAIIASPNHKHQ